MTMLAAMVLSAALGAFAEPWPKRTAPARGSEKLRAQLSTQAVLRWGKGSCLTGVQVFANHTVHNYEDPKQPHFMDVFHFYFRSPSWPEQTLKAEYAQNRYPWAPPDPRGEFEYEKPDWQQLETPPTEPCLPAMRLIDTGKAYAVAVSTGYLRPDTPDAEFQLVVTGQDGALWQVKRGDLSALQLSAQSGRPVRRVLPRP
ncbi:MAG: hypothetical protein AAB320_04905 [Elusimicrobiota bacterium]